MKFFWHVAVQSDHIGLETFGRLSCDFDAPLEDGNREFGVGVG